MDRQCLRCGLALYGLSEATVAIYIVRDSSDPEHVAISTYFNAGIEEADLCPDCYDYFRNRHDFEQRYY